MQSPKQGRQSHRTIGWDIKEDWGLGDASPPVVSWGGAPVGGLEDEAEAFL